MPQICFSCQMGASLVESFTGLKKRKELYSREEVREGLVRVISRRVESGRNVTKVATSWVFLVVFQLENGEEMTLSVEEAQYKELKMGRTGLLKWQGERFLSME